MPGCKNIGKNEKVVGDNANAGRRFGDE